MPTAESRRRKGRKPSLPWTSMVVAGLRMGLGLDEVKSMPPTRLSWLIEAASGDADAGDSPKRGTSDDMKRMMMGM